MNRRQDHVGEHRTAYEKNRKRILETQKVCGICGLPVDRSYKYPHPLSATVDHIIPIARHPSDISNLQLAHRYCNRQKSDKLVNLKDKFKQSDGTVDNYDLPRHMAFESYKVKV